MIPTDKEYTGQRHSRDIDLYDYKARFYDPLLGRFLMEDRIIPNQGVMRLDRYAGMMNNPIRFTDPTGNMVPCLPGDICEHSYEQESQSPWQNDPDRKDWGDKEPSDPDFHPWREERARRVWGWICGVKSWWGGCPNSYNLVAWLVDQELGILMQDEIYILSYDESGRPKVFNPDVINALLYSITYMRDLFSDGISPSDLAKFTAFFNPDSGGSFNAGDWSELMTPPGRGSYNTVDFYINKTNPYPEQDIVWRTPNEINGPSYRQHLLDITHPIYQYVILEFGIR